MFMDDDASGFDCLGADDSKSNSFVDFLKKEGPTLLADVAEGVKSTTTNDQAKAALDKLKKDSKDKAAQSSGESWFSKPVLGPIPGDGVVALVLALVGVGFGVYKLRH